MECNKEEALRARDIAEKKMQIKDFAGALKIAQKAQNLFPELEHLSQMRTVCEVHCAADVKVGGEMDWYGVLQLEPTVDDSSIKKQFRKLALVLHPDKNKFAGAESAFKLIGEANVVLSDKAKRHLYDMKRKVSPRVDPSRQAAPQMRKNTYASDNFSAVNLNGVNNQQKQPSAFATNQTFWTICPVCGMRYQYYKSIMNKSIRCQNCLKAFIAYDISAKVAATGGHPNQSWNTFNPHVHQQTNNTNQPSQSGNTSFTKGSKGSVNGAPHSYFDYGGGQPNVERNKVDHNDGAKRGAKPPTANVSQKRSRKLVIESSDSDTCGDSEDEATQVNGPQTQTFSSSSAPTRRSTRHKQNINYSEVGSNVDVDDDDFSDSPNCEKPSCLSSGSSDEVVLGSNISGFTEGNFKNNLKDESFKDHANGSKQANIDIRGKSVCEGVAYNSSSTMAAPELDSFSYPDPEFFDFDKLRHTNQFAVDQIWALYDDVDGMPRFYARIRQVCSTRFKIQFTWLECNPLNDIVGAWCEEELPIACGNYILGSLESIEDQLMFSHVMSSEKGKKRNSYNIYPRKGEVWALFKNWNSQWNLDADNHRLYEYEVVEVLSDFAEVTGIQVTPLVKINGFVSLFMRSEEKVMAAHVIPPDEILRFSHNVPSYRLTGTEREGIPQGCLELDPASLPINFSDSFPSISLCNVTSRTENLNEPSGSGIKAYVEKPGTSGLQGSKDSTSQNLSQNNVKGKADWRQAKNDGNPPKIDTTEKDELDTGHISSENENLAPISSSNPSTFEYPDAEFHNFDDARTLGNVRRGQIWAIFSELDGHPNYYGLVKKVESNIGKVHVAWLEPCPVSAEQERWMSEGMPISCGTFKVDHYHIEEFDKIGSFSHLVQAKTNAFKKGRYDILPSHGQIWAVYKNWDARWTQTDWQNCEYHVVVICQCTDAAIKIKTLTKVDGYRAVFKQDVETTAGSMDIPACEYVRFSHRIPSFRLTNEKGGKLRGCWELDTVAVPEILLI